MKLKSILTEISDPVNKNGLFWLFVILLVASLFYMIGWISNELSEGEELKIEDPPEISQKTNKYNILT